VIEIEPPRCSFSSDNAAGVLDEVMAALVEANEGGAVAYGADRWTETAKQRFNEIFDAPTEVAFTWGGTGANVVALASLLRPWEAVIVAASGHINVDECGAVERFSGAKIIDLPSEDGKLRPDQLAPLMSVRGDQHHSQPAVVSITQSTEYGTLYSATEITAICEEAHRLGLRVHLDGARISNATAALGGDLASFTTAAGVDVVSFGGTKAGMMYGEAIVFLRPELAADVRFVRKQAAQLPSKMRFVAAQFNALLADGLWVRSAAHANSMATMLAEQAGQVDQVLLRSMPEVNAVFARLPRAAIDTLQQWSFFWDWDPAIDEVRWMTSFATTPEDVERFVEGLRCVLDGS
jgi:threonine aldolase